MLFRIRALQDLKELLALSIIAVQVTCEERIHFASVHTFLGDLAAWLAM